MSLLFFFQSKWDLNPMVPEGEQALTAAIYYIAPPVTCPNVQSYFVWQPQQQTIPDTRVHNCKELQSSKSRCPYNFLWALNCGASEEYQGKKIRVIREQEEVFFRGIRVRRGKRRWLSETDMWYLSKKRILNLQCTRGTDTAVLTEEGRSIHHWGAIMSQSGDQMKEGKRS